MSRILKFLRLRKRYVYKDEPIGYGDYCGFPDQPLNGYQYVRMMGRVTAIFGDHAVVHFRHLGRTETIALARLQKIEIERF